MALNVAFSVVFDEATDTDSEDNVELRPSEDEACKAFRKWGVKMGVPGDMPGPSRTPPQLRGRRRPKRNAQRMRVSARSSAEGESYADRIAGVARGSNSSQSFVTKLDGAQT